MFRDHHLAGSWAVLTARLDAADALGSWARREPLLSSVSRVADLAARTKSTAADGDPTLGAVVRLAAVGGGADEDAVLVVLHLLSEGVSALACRLADLAPDMPALVVGELAAQIREFPVHRRTRAYAANLLLDTRAAVLAELLPHRRRPYAGRVVLVDSLKAQRAGSCMDRVVLGPGDSPDLDVLDLLQWAQACQVAPSADLTLLLELARSVEDGPGARERVAQVRGVNERTVRRRRDRTLTALRGASGRYLSAVA